MNNLFLIYCVLSIANVIIQTIKSIATIKCGKTMASIVNAIAYGLYTVVLVYTNADFPLYQKVLACAITNLIGVYVVKYVEEKMKKDKLWRVEMSVAENRVKDVVSFLENTDIPYNFSFEATRRYAIFNVYCATQKESESIKELVKRFRVKYFVTESKVL